MKTLFLALILTSSIVSSFTLAHAQGNPRINLSPESPEPGSSVTLSLSGYSFDLNTALIEWKVDGISRLKGVGERKLTLETGSVGDTQTVTVTAASEVGHFVEQKIVITPASVILMHESPNSYVPLFYEGRSFASTAGLVRVTAFPSLSDNKAPLNPEVLSYTWYLNGDLQSSASGRGRQSFDARLDYLRDKNEIKVVVRTPAGSSVSKTTSISPREISPIFYKYDEILGTLLNSSFSRRLETTKTVAIRLEPYFVSHKESVAPTYKWLLDGFNVSPGADRVLALVPKENSHGVNELVVTVAGPDRRLQLAETSLEIIFDTRK